MTDALDYAGNILKCKGECPACAYANHEFSLPCGMAYEDEICTASQDWQLPINGMIIVAPKRHVTTFEQLTKNERIHLFEVTNRIISILRKNYVSKDFNVIFEEKKNIHFHIWILPRDGWKEIGIDPTKDIRNLMEYALTNLRNETNFRLIENTTKIIKEQMNI